LGGLADPEVKSRHDLVITVQDIVEATNIPPEDLKRSLQSLALVKGKNILRKEPLSR
jgi:cullin 3